MAAELRKPTVEEIARDWEEFSGGPPLLAALGTFQPGDVDGLLFRDEESGRRAMITWVVRAERAELTSVHADPPGGGLGAEMMDRVERLLQEQHPELRTLLVATTSDNPRALHFYLRHGFRLVRLELDHMDKVREAKPHVPTSGNEGLPLQDLWVLEKRLG